MLPHSRSLLRQRPAVRLAFGMVILTSCLLLTADLILGLVPNEASARFKVHQRTGETLAIQLTPLVERQDFTLINHLLQTLIGRNSELLSSGLRDKSGTLVAQSENHAHSWAPPADNHSTTTSLTVPIRVKMSHWGQLEMAYRPGAERSATALVNHPSLMLSAIMCSLGFLLFYLYLRRILRHLNPGLTVPGRVRTAFDSLSEAVIVIDNQGNIVLANDSFRALNQARSADLTGKKLSEIAWLLNALDTPLEQPPWERAMRDKRPVTGTTISVMHDGESPQKLAMNSAPIVDEEKNILGCLITLDDLSLIEHMNQQLLDMVAQLKVANSQIEERNRELKHMADHDQLTGALTRRAFFERAQHEFSAPLGAHAELGCLVLDIDHFKSINDRYGHLVGDQALQCVVEILRENLNEHDLVCRYGGEEFCVLVRGNVHRAQELAEKLRFAIESRCGATVIQGEAARITASLGVSTSREGATTLTELIDQADQALYFAKGSGRNRVCRFKQTSSKHDRALGE